MKIKGRTIIELTDVRTEKIQRFEDDNAFMDTNIEQKFRNFGIFQTSVLNNFQSTPLWQKLCGGLLLLDSVVADGANFVAPGQKMTGRGYYGSSNNGSPVSLGSWNATESAVSSNAVQMVYDFTTSQGNGDIKAVCLTSDAVGRCGIGNQDDDYNVGYSTDVANWQSFNKSFDGLTNLSNGHAFDGEYIYFNPVLDGTSLTISKKYANARKVDLIHMLTDANTAGIISLTLSSALAHDDNIRLIQASDTRLIVVGFDSNSETAFSTVEIDLSAIPITATVREISGIPALDNYESYGYSDIDCLGVDGSGNPILVFGSYAYKPKAFAVNIGTGAKHSFVWSDAYTTWGLSDRQGCNIIPMGNGNFIAASIRSQVPGFACDLSDDSIKPCEAYNANSMTRAYNGLNLIGSSGEMNIRMRQNPFYLATINNLATPVTKTSSQTMKVTYVISRANS